MILMLENNFIRDMISEAVFWIIVAIVLIITFIVNYIFRRLTYKTRYKKAKLPVKDSEIPYCREIPCINLEEAFYIGVYYGVIQDIGDFVGAFLLKWFHEGKIKFLEKNGKMIIDMRQKFTPDTAFEKELQRRLLQCADMNFLLEEKEFLEFFSDENELIMLIFEIMLYNLHKEFEKNGLLVFNEKTKTFVPSAKMEEEAVKLQGLKNYLSDFSKLDERESVQVELWEEYLIYAQLLGIADKVENEFEQIYPEYLKIASENIKMLALRDTLMNVRPLL